MTTFKPLGCYKHARIIIITFVLMLTNNPQIATFGKTLLGRLKIYVFFRFSKSLILMLFFFGFSLKRAASTKKMIEIQKEKKILNFSE